MRMVVLMHQIIQEHQYVKILFELKEQDLRSAL
jgi:hypothetical protein